MADKQIQKNRMYRRRKLRVRSTVLGTPERPRLSVRKSLKHIYVQIIDDTHGATLAAVSTLTQAVQEKFEGSDKKSQKGFKVGLALAELAKAKGIGKVVFDRQGYLYHGRIKAVAEGARKGGLEF